jgi:23S rRNA pseudouridine1911/1915/1917 synthase
VIQPTSQPGSVTAAPSLNPHDVGDAIDYIDDGIALSAAGAEGQRLDKWLAAQLPQFSRSRLQTWIALGAVGTDDMAVSQKYKLRGHERIVVRPQALEAQQAFVAEDIALDVVFEDDALLIINKPAGLVVHPAPGNWSGTLMNGLLHRGERYFELPRAGIVHRLDKDTSGLMVVAKTEMCRQALIAMIAKREVSRRYFALVHKRAPNAFSVDAAVGRDPHHRQRMAAFSPESTHAKPAKTDFRRLQFIAERESFGPASAIECRLHSGRTHQIRVHAAHLGLPLLGDPLYGGPRWPGLERQALHAWRLAFDHPIEPKTSSRLVAPQRLDFVSPLPSDLVGVVEAGGGNVDVLFAARDGVYA